MRGCFEGREASRCHSREEIGFDVFQTKAKQRIS